MKESVAAGPSELDAASKVLCGVYAAIAVFALVGTWSQNLIFLSLPDNGGVAGFVAAAMSNPAGASLTIDLGFLCLALFVWMVHEAYRLDIRFVAVYIALSMLVAVSVFFPLFLIARQLKLPRDPGLRLP